MSPKSWYKRSIGDFTCRNKSKKNNDISSFEESFSRKISLKIFLLVLVIILLYEQSYVCSNAVNILNTYYVDKMICKK